MIIEYTFMEWFKKYINKKASEGSIMDIRQGRDMPDDLNHLPVIDVVWNEINDGLISLFHDQDIQKYKMDCIVYPVEEGFYTEEVDLVLIEPGKTEPVSHRINKLTTFGKAREIARNLALKHRLTIKDNSWTITNEDIDELFNP